MGPEDTGRKVRLSAAAESGSTFACFRRLLPGFRALLPRLVATAEVARAIFKNPGSSAAYPATPSLGESSSSPNQRQAQTCPDLLVSRRSGTPPTRPQLSFRLAPVSLSLATVSAITPRERPSGQLCHITAIAPPFPQTTLPPQDLVRSVLTTEPPPPPPPLPSPSLGHRAPYSGSHQRPQVSHLAHACPPRLDSHRCVTFRGGRAPDRQVTGQAPLTHALHRTHCTTRIAQRHPRLHCRRTPSSTLG